jgi:ketosteroid isomerase-like protein
MMQTSPALSNVTQLRSDPIYNQGIPEVEIRQRIEDYFDAVRSGELDRILSFFADDVVGYDMPPKLRFEGIESYKTSWEKCFVNMFEFPVSYELRDERIFSSGDIALVHGLVRMQGKFKNPAEAGEERVDCWMRQTLGLKRVGGQWLIVHDHISIPIDYDGKGLMKIDPNSDPELE